MLVSLNALDAVLQDFHIRPGIIQIIHYALQKALHFPTTGTQSGYLQAGFMVMVLQTDLCRGDIEFTMQPNQNWLNPAALLF
jgi:hypothetical protein